MAVTTVRVSITGTMPILFHADSIDWADKMDAWKRDSKNKAVSKAGDDRTPAWRWIGCLNYDHPKTGVVTIPSEYIMRCIMGGAAQVSTGKGKGTFKSLSQSGLLCADFHWPLLVSGKPISMADINELLKEDDFAAHKEAAEVLGFTLFVKRAKIGQSKHIRVRPRFDNWAATGELIITDPLITKSVLLDILSIAGRLKGLGDWRPGAPTPGPFGTFTAEIS